jgi:amyloid beta precursor protein binding protein 1
LNPFSLIIVSSPISPDILSQISEHATKTSVPLFYIHSVGFYAHFSIHLPHTFPIVDTHPDPTSTTDLRLVKPWPELAAFAAEKTKGLDTMDHHDHGHVPYVLLLLHHLEEWKKSHDGNVPSVYKEKNEFRELVRAGMQTNNAEGGEENYEEAIAAVLKSLNEPTPSSAVKEVFSAEECTGQVNKDVCNHFLQIVPLVANRYLSDVAQTANFWIIAAAISQFYKKDGLLPLPGSVPDMKAQSADYISLQNIYKAKARADVQSVLEIVRQTEKEVGRTTVIEESEVEAFCKNAAHIKLVRGRSFYVAKPGVKIVWGDRAKAAANALTDDTSLVLMHIAFLAYDLFYATNNSAPGVADADQDAQTLTGTAFKIIDDLINEASKQLDSEELVDIKEKAGEMCQEM